MLEDDCAPSPSFFRFATDCLVRYKDNPRVGMITGQNMYGVQTRTNESYHFTRHTFIWGWASWSRVWQDYDVTLERYAEQVKREMDVTGKSRYEKLMAKYLRGVQNGLDTWDIQLGVMMRAKGYLAVMPRRQLVRNLGFYEGALHTGGFVYDQPYYAECHNLQFPLSHPTVVACDEIADRREESRSSSYIPRALTVIGLKLGLPGRAVCAFARCLERICPRLFCL